MQALSAEKEQVGSYKSTNTDAAAGTKVQILTQPYSAQLLMMLIQESEEEQVC